MGADEQQQQAQQGAEQAAPSAPPAETQAAAPAYVAKTDEQVNRSGVEKPDQPQCPNCGVGVLYVITWDPNATHEIGQPIYAPAQLSGGSVTLSCFNCGFGETRPMNPQTAPPNPNPGA